MRDLASYFQLPRAAVATAVMRTELVRSGVEGWEEDAWVHPAALGALTPNSCPVFLSPFDNLIWDRQRTRRIFGFEYSLEAYKPAAKRIYGYYVMPLLANGEILGRADIARDKETLRVLQFHPETGTIDASAVVMAANTLAAQLGCNAAEVTSKTLGRDD